MSITAATDLSIADQAQLILPPSAAAPLSIALGNCNHGWRFYCPPLLSFAPEQLPGTRQTVVLPALPSADGLEYTFEHRVTCDATTTLTITVKTASSYTGLSTTWTTLYTVTPAAAAGVLLAKVDTGKVIPSSAEVVQITYETASGDLFVHHCMAYPAPTAAPSAGVKASGVRPYDSGLLAGVTGAPITTEHLNRVPANARALAMDRLRCVASFVQAEGNTVAHPVTSTDWVGLPQVCIPFPYQGAKVRVMVLAIASVDAGATTGLLRLGQIGPQSSPAVVLDADRTVQYEDGWELYLQGEGPLRHARINIMAKATTGNTTRLHALLVLWRPTD